VVSVEGGTPQRISEHYAHYGQFEGLCGRAAWSPDGLQIAFATDRGLVDALFDTWIASRQTVDSPWGDPVQLTDFGCTYPDWDPARVEIVCSADGGIYRLSSSGEVLAVYRPSAGGSALGALYPRFSPEGNDIYFYSFHDGSWAIWRMPSTGGDATKVVRLDDPRLVPFGLSVGDDEIYITLSEMESDIWVMDLDW